MLSAVQQPSKGMSMSAMQRVKGKVFERKVATILREKWPGVEVRRGQQGGGAHESDVYVSKGVGSRIWWELTDGVAPNPAAKMTQAIRDIEASRWTLEEKQPVIVWHKKGSRVINATMAVGSLAWLVDGACPMYGSVVVTMTLSDFLGVL